MQNTYSSVAGIIVSHLLDEYLQVPVAERPDRVERAKERQVNAEETLLPENVVKRLFGFTAPATSIQPALNLESYQGIYSHPAHHKLKITVDAALAQTMSGKSLRLESAGEISCTPLVGALHHVNAESWWVHTQRGPRSWILDDAVKLQFVVGPEGNVEGMRYEVEEDSEDELAFFKKIE